MADRPMENVNYVNPTKFDRWLLVRYKKFPDLQSVPNSVSLSTVRLVKNKARIHANLAAIGVFSVVLFAQAIRGRNAHKEGRSVTNQNLDWHRKFNQTGVVGSIRADPPPDPDLAKKSTS